MDSGADNCFIDPSLTNELDCLVEDFEKVKRVRDLDGRILSEVRQITGLSLLKSSGNHVKQRRFSCLAEPHHSSLGYLNAPFTCVAIKGRERERERESCIEVFVFRRVIQCVLLF